MNNAVVTKMQRFGVFFIDMAIVALIATILAYIFKLIIGYNFQAADMAYENVKDAYTNYIYGKCDEQTLLEYVKNYIPYYLVDQGISLGFTFLISIVYFVVLPCCLRGQTCGRALVKASVVNVDGSRPSAKKLAVRELLIAFLIYSVFGGILIWISIILVLATNRSLVDILSKTDMVFLPAQEKRNAFEEPNSFEKQFSNNDYIDAEAKEVKNEEEPKSSNDNSEDDDYKFF